MVEKDKQRIYPKSPIGIVALFVLFIEAVSTVSLKFLLDASSPFTGYMITFIIVFPTVIVVLFFITIWFKRESLFSPSDFREDASFLQLFNNVTTLAEKQGALLNESRVIRELAENSNSLQNTVADQSRDLLKLTQRIGELSDMDLSLRLLMSLRPEAPPSEQAFLIEETSSYLDHRPTDRMQTIMLARLYRAVGRIEEAVTLFNRFLESKDKLGEKDKDYSDILYNRACYKALLANQTDDDNQRRSAIEDLKISIQLSPENLLDARVDSDLDCLRGDLGLKELLQEG